MKKVGKKADNDEASAIRQEPHLLTLGEYAQQVIAEQFQRIIKQEPRVLQDKNPEHLHQMRVGTRRLRTALQVFEQVVDLPKSASSQHVKSLAKVLGEVRDLDVQTASLREEYQPRLNKREQKQLAKAIAALVERRIKAVARMKEFLKQPQYQQFKRAYETWLKRPDYAPIQAFPLKDTLPDLLSPLLSTLLLHPGWLISTEQASGENSLTLHDLRKECKHARYQAEFFMPFYGEEFHRWIEEIKTLQECLGAFQDTQVLLELIAQELGKTGDLPMLQEAIETKQLAALSSWEQMRQKYLDSDYRHHLRQLLLQPMDSQTEPSGPLTQEAKAALN